jgi:hypothetical protein
MKYHDPLKQILSLAMPHWNRDESHPAARWAFGRATQCRTDLLGSEAYASEHEEKIFPHTCKSRCCSSCGHRASLQWRRERRAALPAVAYKGITFTMPDVLWPFFKDNSALLRALPALAATVIQARIGAKHALQLGVIAIPHTFNGKLEFNSHVHTMVTAGGLHGNFWLPRLYFDRDRLMRAWRRAVIRLLRTALRLGQLRTDLNINEVELLLNLRENQWWSVKIQSFASQEHFLEYAGRYVRRPPIAQYRITQFSNQTVTFWYNDKMLHRRAYVQCSLEEFCDRWAQHVPERYQHAVRNFGLFGPRSIAKTNAAVFVILGQTQQPRPRLHRWAYSIKHSFGYDPLLDRSGNKMKWVRRIPPKTAR